MSGTFYGTILQALQTLPGLAIFLSLTVGYAIGQIRLGPIFWCTHFLNISAQRAGEWALWRRIELATEMYGPDFVKWMMGRMKPNQALFQLAEETGVILLPGKGFGTPHPSWRVSLANLNEYDYANIGKAIRKLAREYYEKFIVETGASEPPPAEKAAKVVSKEKAKSKKK